MGKLQTIPTPQELPPPLLTDRTSIETDWTCGMRYWWYKHEGGGGIVPVLEADYYLNGRILHDDLAMFAEGLSTEEILARAQASFTFAGEVPTQLEQEDQARREGWIVAFGWLIWPYLMERFEVVKFEWETVLDRTPLWVAIKPDLLLRNKQTGKLVYVEYKSTGTTQPGFALHWPYASQIHLGLAAVQEELGEEIDYGQVLGLYKGRWAYGRLGHPYVWAYFNTATEKWSAKYQRGPDWIHRPVWEYDGGVYRWVHDECGEETGREQFVWSEPVFLSTRHVHNLIVRRTVREREVVEVKAACQEDREAREIYFERRTTQCKPVWGSECPYLACCENKSVGDAPLKSGLYVPRTPHHEVELVGVG